MVFLSQILGCVQSTSSRQGLVLAILVSTALVGCGQKGPLFLPTPPTTPQERVAVPQSAVVKPLLPASAVR